MKPHALRGTPGAAVLADLEPQPDDIILPKRRFSAFFKTDLDQTLRTMRVDTVAVGGINTHFCVIATALDALSHDFYTVILEDLSAAYKREIHESFMTAYRRSAIYPIFRIGTSQEFLNAFKNDQDQVGSSQYCPSSSLSLPDSAFLFTNGAEYTVRSARKRRGK